MKNIKSQKGYSLVEVGIGIVIISVFMLCSLTMIRGTYNTYRYIEQKNIAMSYLIKGVEKELLYGVDGVDISITDNPANTVVTTNTTSKKVTVTTIPNNNMVLTTTLESLPSKNGRNYATSDVKLLTAKIEFYLKKGDASSKRELTLETIKIGGDGLGT
ncbi:MAG: type II secretion system protein [Clostridia bacterium]|nr:type II secretion system protein [Clostridia bacterium]